MALPFDRFDPTGPELPVIVEVPHAGLAMEARFLEPMSAPARAIARDADLYVDALYEDAPAAGATVLTCRVSRYVIDVNRAESDVDGEVVEGGRADTRMHHGLVWRTTGDGEPALARRLTNLELEERLALVWRPYHRELAAIIERKRSLFGLAVVLAAHSMPSVERGRRGAGLGGPGEASDAALGAAPSRRADVVPGTRGRKSAAPQFIEAVESHAVACGWTVRHDDPYAGGFTTQHYGRPAERVHAVQVELARRLYLDETALRPLPTFQTVRDWCRGLVTRLGHIATSSA
jgi:N-formylglutamate amidohydrolase